MAVRSHDHDTAAHPDAWAKRHAEEGALREPELRKATRTLLAVAEVGRGRRVLDIACGAGDTTAAAAATGADATGLDSSADMVRIATERFPGSRFVVGDMRRPPDGPWDAIVCRLGAHHADPSWLSAALAVLRPGGRLAIAERDAVDASDRANGMRRLDTWTGLFVEAGFEEVRVTRSEAMFPGPLYVISGMKPATRPS